MFAVTSQMCGVSGLAFVRDLTTLAGIGAWLAAWGNWLGLLAFVLLGLALY